MNRDNDGKTIRTASHFLPGYLCRTPPPSARPPWCRPARCSASCWGTRGRSPCEPGSWSDWWSEPPSRGTEPQRTRSLDPGEGGTGRCWILQTSPESYISISRTCWELRSSTLILPASLWKFVQGSPQPQHPATIYTVTEPLINLETRKNVIDSELSIKNFSCQQTLDRKVINKRLQCFLLNQLQVNPCLI